jgi:hypothetical protein
LHHFPGSRKDEGAEPELQQVAGDEWEQAERYNALNADEDREPGQTDWVDDHIAKEHG